MTAAARRRSPGVGHPRLIFAAGGEVSTHDAQREFALVDEVTTIGSAADSDLVLDGLEPHHAQIRRDEHDDYTYVPLGAATGSSVHGRPGETAVLRTGTRIEFGPWTVSFYREEFADSTMPTREEESAQMRDDVHEAEQDGVQPREVESWDPEVQGESGDGGADADRGGEPASAGDKAEADIEDDPGRANSRDLGGVPDEDATDQGSTTGTTPTESFVGRVAGQDSGSFEEQGAERRAEQDD